MFRFASEYASVKFRSLSGHRLAGSKLGSLSQETYGFPSAVSSASAYKSEAGVRDDQRLSQAEVREDQRLPQAEVREDRRLPQAAASSRVKPTSVRPVVESGQQIPALTRSLFGRLRTRLFGNHKIVPLLVLIETRPSDSLARVVQHEPVKWDLVPSPRNLAMSPRTSSFRSSHERKTPDGPGGEKLERGEPHARKMPTKRRRQASSSFVFVSSSHEQKTLDGPGGEYLERGEPHARKVPTKRRRKASSSEEVSVRRSVAPPQDDEESNDGRGEVEGGEGEDEDQGTRMDRMIEGMNGPEENNSGDVHVDVDSPNKQSVLSLSLPLNQANPSFDTTKALHQTPPVPTSAHTAPQCVGLLPRIDKQDLDLVFEQKGSSYSSVTLGRGDNGQVVLMKRRSDSSLVAVKKLTHTGNPSAADTEFTRETRAMSAVSSSTVFPKLLGVVDRLSFAMEFIGTLDKKTSWSVLETFNQPRLLKSRDWLKVCVDVTKGLMDMHAAGWTHNDLHNANVMVLRDSPDKSGGWEGKIIDLGCASHINDPPPVKQLTKQDKKHCFKYCGQLAPEIIEGTAQYSPLTDVFSLGVLFTDIAPSGRHLSRLKSLGKRCSHPVSKMRPAMGEVLQELTAMVKNHKNTPPKSRLGSLYQTVKHRIRP